MGAAIAVLFVLPWLDRTPTRSIRYRGILFKLALLVFAISFLALGYLGMQPATPEMTLLARIFSFLYFAFFAFLFVMSFVNPNWDSAKPVPERVTLS